MSLNYTTRLSMAEVKPGVRSAAKYLLTPVLIGQNTRRSHVALSPLTSQVTVNGDWQRARDKGQQSPKSSLRSSSTNQPPETDTSDTLDITLDIPLSLSSPNTTLQMVLDACTPWAAIPASPISPPRGEVTQDGSDTTRNDSFQAQNVTTTSDCGDILDGDETSLPTSPENPQDNSLRTGILEELDDLVFGTNHAYDPPRQSGSLIADIEQLPSLAPSNFPLDTRAFQQCIILYFERFHPQWPIVHQATFNPSTATQELVSSMIMVGAWESGVESWMEIAEQWCEYLVTKLSKNYSQAPSRPEVDERTLQGYQALLLNVIFTLECSDDMRFSKAYLRYCMMLAIFRQASLFEEQDNLTVDDPPGAIPSNWLNRESLKRLAFFSFRLDIYFYFLRGYSPLLRYDDLSLTTPCSQRLWEATTAEEWHEVKNIESKRRTAMQFMTLMDIAMDCEGRDTLPALLEDDYLYGLCAMQAWFLRDINKHRSRWQLPEACGIRSPPASSRAIEYWASLLGVWRDCYRDRAIGSPLSSQQHREMTKNNAMPLYHLSHMALRADLKAIKDLAVDRCHQQYSGTCRRRRESRILEWVKTPDARLAMWHAAQISKLLRKTFDNEASPGPGSCRMDFIASVALCEAGFVVWAYAGSVQVCDSCCTGSTLQASNADREPFELFRPQRGEEFQQWVNHGGREQIDGTVICACKLKDLIRGYETMLPACTYQSRSVSEMAKFLALLKHRD
ncbi:hypothetical protein NM208_g3342 [Fusarium decemcellulare]|uniref:Uncharacterized protein n=1 Tax=Fusarium decemcellulare TaxID=57161 RepID=A0ACC1SPX7_9HYPO|nr:hypothetical protein NM208_g3342 [Fusarium decemcellulare]